MSSLVERATVLLSVELGHEKSVVSTLLKVKCVEVHEVYGVCDIIVKMTAKGARVDRCGSEEGDKLYQRGQALDNPAHQRFDVTFRES